MHQLLPGLRLRVQEAWRPELILDEVYIMQGMSTNSVLRRFDKKAKVWACPHLTVDGTVLSLAILSAGSATLPHAV